MARLIADAGLLIAADRNERSAWAVKKAAALDGIEVVVPAPVLAQVWRGPQSVNLARYLKGVAVVGLIEEIARRAGELLAVTGSSDVCDASVVAVARDSDVILTGDAGDITAILERSGTQAVVKSI